jgi:flagellar assembly protein FliH
MGLIKAAQSPPTLKAFSMADIETQANAILSRARQQAEQILTQAKVQATEAKIAAFEEARAMGFKKGVEDGLAQGLKTGKQDGLKQQTQAMQSAIGALNASAMSLEQIRGANHDKLVRDVLSLTFMLVEKITRRRGMLDPTVVLANLAETIRLVGSTSRIRVAISPKDRETLDEAMPKIKAQWPKLQEIEIISDESIAPGGCRLFTAGGEIDATLDGQLSRIAADLLPQEEQG